MTGGLLGLVFTLWRLLHRMGQKTKSVREFGFDALTGKIGARMASTGHYTAASKIFGNGERDGREATKVKNPR